MSNRVTSVGAENLLNLYFPCLDHGFISLVDYMGSDESIDSAARTSYGSGTRKVSDTEKLLRYLKRNLHTSPFEMVELKFHCAMPIFVARQWIRHRTASVNEYSGRYSIMPNFFYEPTDSALALQSSDNKQGRGGAIDNDTLSEYRDRIDDVYGKAVSTYDWMLEEDFAREIARVHLPVSAYTQWYWKIDLHNLMHFLTLRCHPHAQYEIRVYAEIMAAIVKEVAPIAFNSWKDYDLNSCRMSSMEMNMLRNLLTKEQLEEEIKKSNMISGREASEFLAKFESQDADIPSLDFSNVKTPDYFKTKWENSKKVSKK